MRTIFILILLSFLNLNLYSSECKLEIENNPIFSSILEELKKPGTNITPYFLSDEYRLDLSIYDLIVSVDNFFYGDTQKRNQLKLALNQNNIDLQNINFQAWYQTLIELCSKDQKLEKKLNSKLYFQLYSKNSYAIEQEYAPFSIKKIIDYNLRKKINKYNMLATDPEGAGILDYMAKGEINSIFANPIQSPFVTSKTIYFSEKDLKFWRKAYYRKLIYLYKQIDSNYKYIYSKQGLKAKKKLFSKRPIEVKLFNTIMALPHKYEVLNYLNLHLSNKIPTKMGLLVLTPTFILDNLEDIRNNLKVYTFEKIVTDGSNDNYLYDFRKWISHNKQLINLALEKYNETKETKLIIEIKEVNNKKMVSRIDAINLLPSLLEVFPEAPWLKTTSPLIVNKKGKSKYYDLSFKEKMKIHLKNFTHSLSRPNNYITLLVATSVTILTQGNILIGTSAAKLTKSFVSNRIFDHPLKEFFKSIPNTALDIVLLTSGFASGRLFKIIALGAAGGAIQSVMTGQDIKLGAAVGASLSLVQYYLLPYKIAKPMLRADCNRALKINQLLEHVEKGTKATIQASVVAVIEGEEIGSNIGKALIYSAISTQTLIWFLGTRYYPFMHYDDIDIDNQIALENAVQNTYGRGGEYNITRQLITDSNFRVNGFWETLADGATTTLPGNVATSVHHYGDLGTLTHEASHLMQQHQSGVFGFYLLRYIPTFLKFGYDNHPDEVFY